MCIELDRHRDKFGEEKKIVIHYYVISVCIETQPRLKLFNSFGAICNGIAARLAT